MEWVETTGRSLEEAKDAALDQLGVDEQDAEFEVLDEGKLGLFGRVRNEARVRARVRPTRPRAKDEGRDRRRRSQGKRNGRSSDGAETQPSATEKNTAAKSSTEKNTNGGGGGGGGRSRGGGRGPRSESTRTSREPEHESEGADMEVSLAEQAEEAKAFLQGLVGHFDPNAEVAVAEIDEDTAELRVTGNDLGLLIGPKGQTLSAIQELTRTAVQRRPGGGRLLVDVGGYRQKRREALETFTRAQVERVLITGTNLVLEPMSPADRKVVHDTVNTIDGVSTTSEGEEPRRRVVIIPDAN